MRLRHKINLENVQEAFKSFHQIC